MEHERRTALIAYRLEQAKETITEAKLLIDHGKYRAAVNRIYYGMFYALSAIGTQYQFSTSKHGQLIGWFNKEFIKTEILERKYGKMLREAFELRNQGDYDAFITFSDADIRHRFEDMKTFISAIEDHILSQRREYHV